MSDTPPPNTGSATGTRRPTRAEQEAKRQAAREYFSLDGSRLVPIEVDLRKAFPFPPQRVPRVAKAFGYEFRIDPDTGVLQYRYPDGEWDYSPSGKVIRDLLANPFIEVPDDE